MGRGGGGWGRWQAWRCRLAPSSSFRRVPGSKGGRSPRRVSRGLKILCLLLQEWSGVDVETTERENKQHDGWVLAFA